MNGIKVWSAGNTVTYRVDNKVSYTEEVDYGGNCLSPKTFTPVKDGYVFLGWRQDSDPSENVLKVLTMGDSPVLLFAVFVKTVSVNYDLGDATGSVDPTNGIVYYNNGNYTYPLVYLASPTSVSKPGYRFDKWDLGASGEAYQFLSDSDVTATAKWVYNEYVVYTAEHTEGNAYNTTFDAGYVSGTGVQDLTYPLGFGAWVWYDTGTKTNDMTLDFNYPEGYTTATVTFAMNKNNWDATGSTRGGSIAFDGNKVMYADDTGVDISLDGQNYVYTTTSNSIAIHAIAFNNDHKDTWSQVTAVPISVVFS